MSSSSSGIGGGRLGEINSYSNSGSKIWCRFCRLYISNNRVSHASHQSNPMHRHNVDRFIQRAAEAERKRKRDDEAAKRMVARMEVAAARAMGLPVAAKREPSRRQPTAQPGTGASNQDDEIASDDDGSKQESDEASVSPLLLNQINIGEWKEVDVQDESDGQEQLPSTGKVKSPSPAVDGSVREKKRSVTNTSMAFSERVVDLDEASTELGNRNDAAPVFKIRQRMQRGKH